MGKAGTPSGRRFCFTYNNYKNSEVLDFVAKFSAMKTCKFIFQREIGEKGTPHLQGYCEFKNPRDYSFQKKFPSAVHWEKARESLACNVDYCAKSDTKEEGYPVYTNIELPKPRQGVVLLPAGDQGLGGGAC